MRTDVLAQALILALLATAMHFIVGSALSSDLRAVWLAGTFFGDGLTPENIYAASDGVFAMQPPRLWVDHVLSEGIETPVYPFIYPPLWAWVASVLVPLVSFETVTVAATAINIALIASMPFLAIRIAKPKMSATLFLLLSFPLLAFTLPFFLPLEENQPQILVSFLALLAVERAKNGGPVAGGIALAFAASIKLYPAVFALLWLAAGERRASASFWIAGGALASLSLLVAGWPMHEAFLREISAISQSALYSTFSFSIDPFIAKFGFSDELLIVSTEETGGDSSWLVVAKTPAWRALNAVLFIAVLLLLVRLARRGATQRAFFWPSAFLLLALVSPLTWIYHLMPALVFVPALFTRFPLLPTLGFYFGLITFLRVPALFGEYGLLIGSPGAHELVFGALLLLAGIYLFLATDPADRPLHREPQPL